MVVVVVVVRRGLLALASEEPYLGEEGVLRAGEKRGGGTGRDEGCVCGTEGFVW